LVFVLAALLFSWWRRTSEGYGVMNLLRGEKPGPKSPSAKSDKPKLDAE
jgi:hypothetical protein